MSFVRSYLGLQAILLIQQYFFTFPYAASVSDEAATEDLFRADRVNENYMDLMVRMKNNFFFQSYREKQKYESGSRFAKKPCALLQYQILIPNDLVIII